MSSKDFKVCDNDDVINVICNVGYKISQKTGREEPATDVFVADRYIKSIKAYVAKCKKAGKEPSSSGYLKEKVGGDTRMAIICKAIKKWDGNWEKEK